MASCNKGSTQNNKTETFNGRLSPKPAAATYTYGTHVIYLDKFVWYVLESTSINLDSYSGDSVQVVVKDMGIQAKSTPPLYNVIAITPL